LTRTGAPGKRFGNNKSGGHFREGSNAGNATRDGEFTGRLPK